MLLCDVDDLRELRVALGLEADVARVDAVLVERCGAVGIVGQQLVADVVEVADERHINADPLQPLLDPWHLGRCFCTVHRDADDFRPGAGERGYLRDGCIGICRVGVGHGLHHDRRITANHHIADLHTDGGAAGQGFREIIDHHRNQRVLSVCPSYEGTGADFPAHD